jgi:hypothetical protein
VLGVGIESFLNLQYPGDERRNANKHRNATRNRLTERQANTQQKNGGNKKVPWPIPGLRFLVMVLHRTMAIRNNDASQEMDFLMQVFPEAIR